MKEVEKLGQIYKHYLEKRKEIMVSTEFKVEALLGDEISTDSFLPEQITKPKKCLAKIL